MDALPSLLRLSLKYCERCGGLWLRPQDVATPYCHACERLMAQLPVPAPRRPPSRTRAGVASDGLLPCKPLRRAAAASCVISAMLIDFPQKLLAGWCA